VRKISVRVEKPQAGKRNLCQSRKTSGRVRKTSLRVEEPKKKKEKPLSE
jgi:hypothetical protein